MFRPSLGAFGSVALMEQDVRAQMAVIAGFARRAHR